jgi:hypothetical protein
MSAIKPPSPPAEERTLCVVCAWRATCQKKFTYEQAGSGRCPDYTRDLALPIDHGEKK